LAHYKMVMCDWLIDQFLKVFFVIIASSCILSTCSVRTAPMQSQHVASRCTLRNSRPRLLLRLLLSTRRWSVYGDSVYERRQNGWLHAQTAGAGRRQGRCRGRGGHAPHMRWPPLAPYLGFTEIENFLYNYNSHCFQGTRTVQSVINCALSRHQPAIAW